VEVLADLLVADEGVDEALCVLLLAAHEQEHLLAGGMQLQHTGTRAYPIVTTRPFPYFRKIIISVSEESPRGPKCCLQG